METIKLIPYLKKNKIDLYPTILETEDSEGIYVRVDKKLPKRVLENVYLLENYNNKIYKIKKSYSNVLFYNNKSIEFIEKYINKNYYINKESAEVVFLIANSMLFKRSAVEFHENLKNNIIKASEIRKNLMLKDLPF